MACESDESFEETRRPANAEAEAAALFPAVVDSLGDVHYGFVMQSVSSMQIAGRYQRFYPLLVASYHGLSLMGMDMLSYDVPKKPKPVVAAAPLPPLPLLSPHCATQFCGPCPHSCGPVTEEGWQPFVDLYVPDW